MEKSPDASLAGPLCHFGGTCDGCSSNWYLPLWLSLAIPPSWPLLSLLLLSLETSPPAIFCNGFAQVKYNYIFGTTKGEFSIEPRYALVKIAPSVYKSVQVY